MKVTNFTFSDWTTPEILDEMETLTQFLSTNPAKPDFLPAAVNLGVCYCEVNRRERYQLGSRLSILLTDPRQT